MSGIDSQTTIANRQDYDHTSTNEFDNDQTSANLITPTSGKGLEIKGVYVSSEATSGYVRLVLSGDTVATVYCNSQSGYIPTYKKGDRNAPLKITSTLGAAKHYFLLVNYKEL